MLKPENPMYPPLAGDFQVLGRVVGALRAYDEVLAWA